jgi:hypothetical protein
MHYYKMTEVTYMKCLKRKLIKIYLKTMTKEQRRYRQHFVGKALKHIQYNWLHYNTHPYEVVKNEDEKN